jgi:transcriptional regulator with XRE-family HTH domain
MSKFIEKIKLIRDERGIKQETMAHYAGVTPGAMSKWLAGQGHPNPYQFRKLAEFLRVSMDYLTDDKQAGIPGPATNTVTVSDEELRILDYARDLGLDVARRRLLMLEEPPKVEPSRPYSAEKAGSKSASGRRNSS